MPIVSSWFLRVYYPCRIYIMLKICCLHFRIILGKYIVHARNTSSRIGRKYMSCVEVNYPCDMYLVFQNVILCCFHRRNIFYTILNVYCPWRNWNHVWPTTFSFSYWRGSGFGSVEINVSDAWIIFFFFLGRDTILKRAGTPVPLSSLTRDQSQPSI